VIDKLSSELRLLFLVPTLLAVSLFCITLTVLAGTALAYPDGYPDPFAPYDEVMPGQPAKALEVYPCVSHVSLHGEGQHNLCYIWPEEAIFRSITATVCNEIILDLTFNVKNVQIVDLVELWGRPDTIDEVPRAYRLRWDEGIYAVSSATERFTFQSFVVLVSISSNNKAESNCESASSAAQP
jgi:hypothetical protein